MVGVDDSHGYSIEISPSQPTSRCNGLLGKVVALVADAQSIKNGQTLATIRGRTLVLCDASDLPADRSGLVWSPVVPVKQRAGVDGKINTDQLYQGPLRPIGTILAPRIGSRYGLELVEALDLIGITDARQLPDPKEKVRVAILDTSFGTADERANLGLDELPDPTACALGAAVSAPSPMLRAPHGLLVAATVRRALLLGDPEVSRNVPPPAADLRLYRFTPNDGLFADPYRTPIDLAVTIATAVSEWEPHVIIIAASDDDWGTPAVLAEVLREAARPRYGKDGKVEYRGAAIFCSPGVQSRGGSAAMSSDALAAQPSVFSVAPVDSAGRWYRNYLEPGGIYGRLGPNVFIGAPSEQYRVKVDPADDDSFELFFDDASLATPLAASAAALVLHHNPALSLDELHTILEWTADVPRTVDDGPGTAAAMYDDWDYLGRNLKIGAGRVNAHAAALAARDPLCLAFLLVRRRGGCVPLVNVVQQDLAYQAAVRWDREITARFNANDKVALAYGEHRRKLVSLALHSLPTRRALTWVARHFCAVFDAIYYRNDQAWQQQEHGSLVERLHYTVETAGGAARHAGLTLLAQWLAEVDAMIGQAGVVDWLFGATTPGNP